MPKRKPEVMPEQGMTRDDAENVYIKTERDFCVNVEGVEAAVYAGMTRRLEALREGNE